MQIAIAQLNQVLGDLSRNSAAILASDRRGPSVPARDSW
jgi:hypothetical protein